MATRRTKTVLVNGFWLYVVRAVVIAGILAGVTVAWKLNGRVTRNETRVETMGTDIAEIKGDVKKLLRLLPQRGRGR